MLPIVIYGLVIALVAFMIGRAVGAGRFETPVAITLASAGLTAYTLIGAFLFSLLLRA